MVTDLQSQDNKLHRLFEKFSNESKTVTIASIALIASLLALLMALIAADDAKDAKIRAEYQDAKIAQLSDEVAYWTAHTTALRAELKANGYEPPPLEEK